MSCAPARPTAISVRVAHSVHSGAMRKVVLIPPAQPGCLRRLALRCSFPPQQPSFPSAPGGAPQRLDHHTVSPAPTLYRSRRTTNRKSGTDHVFHFRSPETVVCPLFPYRGLSPIPALSFRALPPVHRPAQHANVMCWGSRCSPQQPCPLATTPLPVKTLLYFQGNLLLLLEITETRRLLTKICCANTFGTLPFSQLLTPCTPACV